MINIDMEQFLNCISVIAATIMFVGCMAIVVIGFMYGVIRWS